MVNLAYCPPFWIKYGSSSMEKIFLSLVAHILVGHQTHFNAVTSGCSCMMPLFCLVCAEQTAPTPVHRDQPAFSVLDNSYLSALIHNVITA